MHPAVFDEEFLVLAEDAAGFAEQFDLVGEAVRNLHVGALAPERAVAAFGGFVVEDQKVADLLHVGHLLVVELGDVPPTNFTHGKHPYNSQNSALNQMDAG